MRWSSELPAAEEEAAALELGAEVEADVGGLVVAYVLHDDIVAIDGIGEKGVEAVGRGQGADVEAQMAVVGGAGEHFLAPVAKDVGTEGGVALGASSAVSENWHYQREFCHIPLCEACRVIYGEGQVFADGLVVEQFAQEVAVPPDAEVDGYAGGAVDDLAANVADAAGG